jgi:hypothetical protein
MDSALSMSFGKLGSAGFSTSYPAYGGGPTNRPTRFGLVDDSPVWYGLGCGYLCASLCMGATRSRILLWTYHRYREDVPLDGGRFQSRLRRRAPSPDVD